MSNRRAKLILSSIADPTTTGDIAQTIGEIEVARLPRIHPRRMPGDRDRSRSHPAEDAATFVALSVAAAVVIATAIAWKANGEVAADLAAHKGSTEPPGRPAT